MSINQLIYIPERIDIEGQTILYFEVKQMMRAVALLAHFLLALSHSHSRAHAHTEWKNTRDLNDLQKNYLVSASVWFDPDRRNSF